MFFAAGAAFAKGLFVEAKAANPEADGVSFLGSVLALSAKQEQEEEEEEERESRQTAAI